jgi:protein-S-isoprenylcysteine O-methyltransferase Ste14
LAIASNINKGVIMKILKIKPPTYLLISIFIMLALHFLFPVILIVPTGWNLLGVIPLAIGITINLMADKAFHLAETPVCPFEGSSSLVTTGIYGISRNPMYLGFILILIGIAVLLRSLTPYVVVLAFAILMNEAFVSVEERRLASTFGAEWLAYKAHTRRWL